MDSILQNFVVDFMLGYNAFHIPGGRSVPDPTTYLSDVTSPLMVAKVFEVLIEESRRVQQNEQ